MRLSGAPCPDVPIYLATLSPRMLRLTGEIADGWLGTSFVPEAAATPTSPTSTRGWPRPGAPAPTSTSARAPRWRSRPTRTSSRGWSTTGAPGSRSASAAWARRRRTSTTPPTAARVGPRSPPQVRERWLAGDRVGAAALVTDEMVLATTLIGTEAMVRARLAVWQDAGVDTVRLYPAGETLDDAGGHPGPGDRAGARGQRRAVQRAPRDRHPRPVRQVPVARGVEHREVGAGARARSRRCRRGAAPARAPAVAAHSASSGVMPISRTASAIISGIDDE